MKLWPPGRRVVGNQTLPGKRSWERVGGGSRTWGRVERVCDRLKETIADDSNNAEVLETPWAIFVTTRSTQRRCGGATKEQVIGVGEVDQ